MLRQLLTLLAVISGFTLAAAPVSAADTGAVSVAAAQARDDCQVIVSTPLQMRGPIWRQSAEDDRRCALSGGMFVSPTVQLQADRARE